MYTTWEAHCVVKVFRRFCSSIIYPAEEEYGTNFALSYPKKRVGKRSDFSFNSYRTKEVKKLNILWIIGVIGVWLVLQLWVLPKFGVPT